MSTSTITEATRPRLRIQFKLARGLFNKPFKAIVSILSLAALSALHGSLLTLIGYAIKPSDWIDNRDAAYIGCIAGCCLLPFTAAVFVGFLSEFEGICVMSEVAREKWLRNAVTGVNETKDWATLQAGDKKPPNSGKEPQYSGWLALIPMGLFHIPVLTLFGTICGTVGAPITHIDTARASLIRTTIGGASLITPSLQKAYRTSLTCRFCSSTQVQYLAVDTWSFSFGSPSFYTPSKSNFPFLKPSLCPLVAKMLKLRPYTR